MSATRVFVARLAGCAVFDPAGDRVGKVRDVLVVYRKSDPPRVVGLIVEIPGSEAPVQQVVLTGDDADLTALPVHLQHGLDGGPYISSSTDYVIDPKTGWTNVGIRRLMLRGRGEAGVDLVSRRCTRRARPPANRCR